MDDEAVERAARLILEARADRVALAPLPDDLRPTDERDGYRIQDALNGLLTAGGVDSAAGHKIGCTTAVMQAYLNIPNPCAGAVFARTVHRGTGTFRAADYVRVGVECEIAVELAADIDGRARAAGRTIGRGDVGAAVGAV